MSKIKIAVIVLIAIGLVSLIVWAIIESMDKKDTKTGVSSSKIEKAAIASGLPKDIAKAVADAPDSAAAIRKIGGSAVTAVSIANGIAPPISPINTVYGNGTNCHRGDSVINVGGVGQPNDFRCSSKSGAA